MKKTADDRRRAFEARETEGKLLAQALIGRSEKSALRRLRKDGFKPEVLPTGKSLWIDGLSDLNRIRLYVNDDHVVVDARAG